MASPLGRPGDVDALTLASIDAAPDVRLCLAAVERAELRITWLRHLLEQARPTDPRWLQAVHRELQGASRAMDAARFVLDTEVPRGR